MTTTFIVDLQGFQFGKKFVCKEIAIIGLGDCCCKIHSFFNFQLDIDDLSEKAKKQINWLTTNYHGLEWYSDNALEYTSFSRFLNEYLTNAKKILVKGLQKKYFLEEFFENIEITDIESYKCPPLRDLKKSVRHHCGQHTGNNLHCAHQNVNLINQWCASWREDWPPNSSYNQ